jgi:hypothetical protein
MPETSRYACGVLLVAALLAGGCDRFWILSVTSVVPEPISSSCVAATLRQLDGADSVWIRSYSSDTVHSAATSFLVWSERGYGTFQVDTMGADSLQLVMLYDWVGPRPADDSVEARAALFSDAIHRVTRACWGSEPPVAIVLPK